HILRHASTTRTIYGRSEPTVSGACITHPGAAPKGSDYGPPHGAAWQTQVKLSAALGGMRWLMQKLSVCARNWRAGHARMIIANGAARSMRAACNTAWGRMST